MIREDIIRAVRAAWWHQHMLDLGKPVLPHLLDCPKLINPARPKCAPVELGHFTWRVL